MSLETPTLPSGREQIVRRFRPSKALYRFTYSVLVWVYGERCSLCARAPPEIKLEIDHPDGRRDTWVITRLSLRCVRCNRSKFLDSIRSESERERIKTSQHREETRNISWESSRSLELEPTFFLELQRILSELEPGWLPTVKNVESRLAKICGCTQAPVTRWIDRELQPEGRLVISERTVRDGRKIRTEQIIGFRR